VPLLLLQPQDLVGPARWKRGIISFKTGVQSGMFHDC